MHSARGTAIAAIERQLFVQSGYNPRENHVIRKSKMTLVNPSQLP